MSDLSNHLDRIALQQLYATYAQEMMDIEYDLLKLAPTFSLLKQSRIGRILIYLKIRVAHPQSLPEFKKFLELRELSARPEFNQFRSGGRR